MNKYKNVRTNGFASKKEYKRSLDLDMLLKQGLISDLVTQRIFKFPIKFIDVNRQISYRADFSYKITYKGAAQGLGKAGEEIIEDVKGSKINSAWNMFQIKRAMMKHFFNIDIRII